MVYPHSVIFAAKNSIMIQRIQTIWLLLASAGAWLGLKLSFYSGTYTKDNTYHLLTGTDNMGLLIITSLMGALALLSIFLYKNRILQLRLCLGGIALALVLAFLYWRETSDFSTGKYSLEGTIALLAVIVCFVLAARGIAKDEKTVKDSDRLR